MAEDVDRENNAVGVTRIVDEAFKTVERAANYFDAPALGEKGHHADFVAGGDDGFDVGELAQKGGFVGDGDGAGEEVLLVDTAFLLERDAGENVAGKQRLGEFLGLLSVVPDAGNEREIMLETLGGHEGGEFLFTTGFRVANEPGGGLSGSGRWEG